VSGVYLLFTSYLGRMATMVLPLLLTTFVLAVVSNMLQTGFLFSAHGLAPQWSHLNPAQGLKRLFSMQSIAELCKSLLKLGVVGFIAWETISSQVEQLLILYAQGVEAIVQYVGSSTRQICVKAAYVMIVIAVLDYAWRRFQHEKSLRMSLQEIKEEVKQQEGNPQLKARVRSVMRSMARRRMLQDVPKADVVITNPTHLAVALSYKRDEMAAPMVLAKGSGHIAARIRAVAQEHGVPVVENKPVARSLFKMVEVGEAIPEALYKAVAEILAYVYRLKK
jgi:flagellar biosynthetic protein FlhB